MLDSDIAAGLKGRVIAYTGAGISAASGLPVFRGDGGLYDGEDPYRIATPEAFAADPVRVWNWYGRRIEKVREARPNAAHLALFQLESRAERVTIITTNVDPLHQRAGSRYVHRVHGDILETRCERCQEVAAIGHASPTRFTVPPRCLVCEGRLRPNVVWFGERPDPRAFEAFANEIRRATLYLEVGTSGTVTYGLTEIAASLGVPSVRVNPDADPAPGIHVLDEPAEIALPRLVDTVSA